MTEFEFTGRVRAGEEYNSKFVPGFTFKLERSGTQGQPEYEERKFYFSPAVGRSVKEKPTERQLAGILATGRGSFRITSVEMNNHQPGERESLEAMSFGVSIHLMAVHGTPVYEVGADISPPEAIYTADPQY